MYLFVVLAIRQEIGHITGYKDWVQNIDTVPLQFTGQTSSISRNLTFFGFFHFVSMNRVACQHSPLNSKCILHLLKSSIDEQSHVEILHSS